MCIRDRFYKNDYKIQGNGDLGQLKRKDSNIKGYASTTSISVKSGQGKAIGMSTSQFVMSLSSQVSTISGLFKWLLAVNSSIFLTVL